MLTKLLKTNIFRFCSKIKSVSLLKNHKSNQKNLKKENSINEIITHSQSADNLYTFSLNNNISYDDEKVFLYLFQQEYGKKLFLKSNIDLKHILSDFNINDFKEGIKNNDYLIYDTYKNIPEILVLGRSNVGKSSLINKLFEKNFTKVSKSPGKTQNLEFFLINYNKRDTGFILDSPGFGYVDGPVYLRKKFKYLIYTYINYGVRLNLILYLINGEYGMKKVDMEELTFLNKFNKEIQVVLTKVDNLNQGDTIKYVTQISNFTKPLINVRQEIFLTSSRTQFGLNNLRTCIAFDLLKTQLSGINKLNEN